MRKCDGAKEQAMVALTWGSLGPAAVRPVLKQIGESDGDGDRGYGRHGARLKTHNKMCIHFITYIRHQSTMSEVK